MKGTTFNEAVATGSLDAIMTAIQAGLPEGLVTTNKKPVQKEIRSLGSALMETLWTSWCKDTEGCRHLALLQSNGRVKIISQEQLTNYEHRSVR